MKHSCNFTPLIPFSIVNNISISVHKPNFTLVPFMAAYHVNPGALRERSSSSSFISRQTFQIFSNTSANNDMSL